MTTFLALYSGMHLYGFLKARAAFSFGPGLGALIGLFMTTMVFCPILVRYLERWGLESAAKTLAYIGYTWMGCLFIFVCASFLVDGYRIFAALWASVFKTDASWVKMTARTAFLIPFAAAAAIATYGHFEALAIRSERITIKSPKIPTEVGRLRIVQISDVHLGLIVGADRLERILAKVRAARPDVLVSTGDLVDGQIDNLSGVADMLRSVPAKYGKYAVTGNHEFYAGLSHALAITERAGFTTLRGEGVEVPGVISVFGVDDPAGGASGLSKAASEKELLSSSSRKTFTLLLKHRPAVNQGSTGLFDLQLSGHVHGGQIFPFRYMTRLANSYGTGFFALQNHSFLYVSRGSGTWGPPIRFLAPPEVTVIDLVHAEPDR